MAIKFSQFVVKTNTSDVSHIVGYNGADNVQITPTDFVSSGGSGLFLPLAGGTMTGDTIHNDNVKSIYGTGSDLQIFHDGNDSFIIDQGTGGLSIRGSRIQLQKNDGTGFLDCINNQIELKNNGTTVLTALSTGISVTGQASVTNGIEVTGGNANFADNSKARFGASSDLQIYHDGSISKIIESTSELQISSEGSNLYIQSITGENAIKLIPNDSVELYYDNAKKIETTTTGVTITGRLSGLTDPTLAQDAATKSYVDAAGSLDFKGDNGTIGDVNLNTQRLDILGTVNQITTVSSGQSLTIAMPANITISQTVNAGTFNGSGTGASYFAGDVNIAQTTDVGVLNTTNLDNGSAVGLSLTYPTSNVAAGDGLAIAIGVAGRGRSYIANSNITNNLDASNLAFYTESGGVIGERIRITSDGDLNLKEGGNFYSGQLRDDLVSVNANVSTTVLDFTGETAGIYIITVCRSGVSVAENLVCIASWDGSSGTVLTTLTNAGFISPVFVGTSFRVSNANNRTCHATAQPLSLS